jgi:hypothetical protein
MQPRAWSWPERSETTWWRPFSPATSTSFARVNAGRHVTFRALAKREDLRVAYTTIWYSVAVLDQLRCLPADIATALPLSHHKLLVPVKDEELKRRLAERAVQQALPVREFSAVVKAELNANNGDRPRRGARLCLTWSRDSRACARP